MLSLIKDIIPNFDNITKEVFITHADVDHCGLLPLFDIVYASAKSAKSLKFEYDNENNFNDQIRIKINVFPVLLTRCVFVTSRF